MSAICTNGRLPPKAPRSSGAPPGASRNCIRPRYRIFLGQGFTAEFDYAGTRDNSAWLAAPAALDYVDAVGPEAMRAHNAALVRDAGAMLIEAWHSEAAAAPEFCASMVSVRLPGDALGDRDAARRLTARLAERHGIAAPVMVLDNGLWVRVSAQIYNEIGDYQRLAAIGKTLAG